jgi:hypothetical protein
MAQATYHITAMPGGESFSVSVTSPDGRLSGASGFKNEADAKAWVNQRKRRAKADQTSEPQEESEGEQTA